MNVEIKVVRHGDQRYPTAGDWQFDPASEVLTIKVSSLANWRFEMLVAIHELMESLLCIDRGIDEKEVDQFDLAFEARRSFESNGNEEPGDQILSPYRDEHCFATGVERMLCSAMKIPWKRYEEAIEKL